MLPSRLSPQARPYNGTTGGGVPTQNYATIRVLSNIRETDVSAGPLRFHSSDFFSQGTSPLMYLRDSIPNKRFLVDSGAAVSVFPHSSLSPCAPIKIVSANGSTIRCWEERLLPLKFGTRHFSWSFRLAEVDRPILGADFLAANNLLVDVSRHRLLDAAAFKPLPVFSAIADDTETNEYHTILKDFPEVTGNKTTRVQHDTQHHIITLGPPVFA